MDQAYWVFEYIKVLLVYAFMMYIWPAVVFRRHLSGRGRAYRFCFCVNVTILLFNAAVLLLGLVHLLNRWLVVIAYFGVFLVQLVRNYHLRAAWMRDFRSVSGKTMSVRRLLLKQTSSALRRIGAAASGRWREIRGRRAEYAVLLVLTVFAMAYFSVNALQVHSYAFGDQYVHHAWVYDLMQGEVFSDGIYPEGMHAFLYMMTAAFGVRLYSCMLYLGCVHIQVYIISAYLLARTLFGWRMSGLFALAGFLTFDQLTGNGISSIARLAGTLPQEFALYTVFLSACGLIRFLREAPPSGEGEGSGFRAFLKKCVHSGGFVVFVTSAAVSACVHFYASIIAVFVCLVAVCLNLRRVFRRDTVVKLAAGVLAAAVIAGLPMAAARLAGRQPQGSLMWALSVTRAEEPAVPYSAEGELASLLDRTYCEIYPGNRGIVLACTDAAVAAVSLLLLAGLAAASKRKGKGRKRRIEKQTLAAYLFISVTLFVLFAAYQPWAFGLPQLVKNSRLCSTIDMFSMLLYASVLDAVFQLLLPAAGDRAMAALSAAVCAGIYFLALATGSFHGYLYYELTRYPAAVELTKEIVASMPKFKYTIISTTDELYQVRETGFHEEWADMLKRLGDETYTIPTEYLFFFIEKQPLVRSQFSCASGPKWLAAEKYASVLGWNVWQYPEIGHGQVSADYASMPLRDGKAGTYADLMSRLILESKAFEWYERFSPLYPNEGRVIYEDESLLCYCVHQNEFSLFSLCVPD